MSPSHSESGIKIPGFDSHFLDPVGASGQSQGRLRYLAARSRYAEVKAPIHLVYGEKDWSRTSDRQANQRLLPEARFTQVADAGHFIVLERPDVPAELLL